MRLELIPALLILASLLQPAVCEDCSGQVVGEARYPAPTLEVREISGLPVPFQNGLPYPSLERQPSRLYIDLGGEWEAFYDENASQGLTLSPRDPATLALLEERMREVLGLEGWEPVRVPSCNNVRGGRWEA
ncbi:MAG: hypothetical protein DRJ43_07290 [Thermoprotei archaeon]|nr:MAG: hypothetical protein DRJ43_07290 [Thermoprotei archaeon]